MKETPLMKQYFAVKAKYPEAILLFRVGDFYEMYGEDAVAGAAITGIMLTHKANASGTFSKMAGFPHHALDTYLPKLVRAGKKVAICDQLEDPKTTRKIVRRGVTELVTPGVSLNDTVLESKENNFLAAVHFGKKNICGLSFLDISTGEFLVAEGKADSIDKLLNNFSPKEILVEKGQNHQFEELFGNHFLLTPLGEWIFAFDTAHALLCKHFETESLKGFGIDKLQTGISAAGAILHYLESTYHRVSHIAKISKLEEGHYMRLDRFTVRSLELITPMNEEGKSLLDIIDHTVSPPGSRLLRRWLQFPLKDIETIRRRQDITDYYFHNPQIVNVSEDCLRQIGDLERLTAKIAAGRLSPREAVQLKHALHALIPLRQTCLESDQASLRDFGERIDPCPAVAENLARILNEDPPAFLHKGGVIAEGVDKELDELRRLAVGGKDYLAEIQQQESARAGIPLKIAFNNIFGYYIEVRNTHKDKVPSEWIRKQTLVGAERYVTEELKTYEEKILGAEEKILTLETHLFNELLASLLPYMQALQTNAHLTARLDCLISFAQTAKENGYVRPEIDVSDVIDICAGRHPVIEKQLPAGQEYVANDIRLDSKRQIIIITGPNMAGKSALLRQTALITLLAQTGSFVPAQSARIGIVDKLFTRVGASDNLSIGESTFMMEMNEAAGILNNLSPRSLVLFDELGRGTSTYDGLSIAQAIIEYIHETPEARAKMLFATHYHELNEMAQSFPRIYNCNVSVREVDNKVIFLRKLAPGGCAHSFGIHVARMAGLPKNILRRAEKILALLESRRPAADNGTPSLSEDAYQLSFFQLDDPLLAQLRDEIAKLDLNNLTPIEALNTLHRLRKSLLGK
ncbi:MAG: DNA mismatch repair protein MutS [Tannerellaceae bacterium]|jgi:DNA mismatch repair protein MutS|nr:DNA mismatch repair protein MutS [Tannerellaceae bacterium]